MDEGIEQQNMGTIKKTMLMQDHTFRQQVIELHRLYSAQRKLMDELKQETKQPKNYLNCFEKGYKDSVGEVQMSIVEDQSLLRESKGGSCSIDDAANFRASLASYYDLDKRVYHDDSCSSPVGFGDLSINGGSGDDSVEGGEVDLTLSIGFGSNTSSKK